MQHLEILSDHQYGFHHSRSCETLLITLLHDLSRCYDVGIQTDLIFTDFAKAFSLYSATQMLIVQIGMVWHFLSGRTQCIVLDGVSSPSCSVLLGVPQGTVLGPTLFSVYINDLPEISSVKLFADDCIAIHSPADTVKLQEDLCALQDWQHIYRWLM